MNTPDTEWEGKARVQWGMQVGPNSNQQEQEKALIQICNQIIYSRDTYWKEQLQKAREDGYNAGLADGTGKPLLAIEQIREERDTYWKERVEEAYKSGRKSFLKDIIKINHSANGKQVSYVMFDEAGTVDWNKVNEAITPITNEDNLK